jgi:hypothetical protein
MNYLLLSAVLGGFAVFPSTARAQALLETQNLLNSPSDRGAVINADPKAQQADAQVKALGLSDTDQQKMYELSGNILGTLSSQNGGDPNRLNDKVQGYLRDPSSIEKDLTPDQKNEIHQLAQPH